MIVENTKFVDIGYNDQLIEKNKFLKSPINKI